MINLNKYELQFPISPIPITSVSVLLTEDCNLRCTYCFEKHNKNKMSQQVGERMIDFLFENAQKGNVDYISLTMFGGEPMLASEMLEYLTKYAWQQGEKFNKGVQVIIITNGTILTDQMKNFLSYAIKVGKPIQIQISVDGPPEVHDRTRVTIDKKGSFHMIEKNLVKYKEIYGELSNRFINLHGVLSKDNIQYLYESYKFFKEETRFENLWFLPVTEEEWTDEHVQIYFDGMKKIYNDVISDCKNQNSLAPLEKYAPLNRTLTENWGDAPCGAGKNYATITANGEIYPCHHIYFNDPEKETLIGDIWTGVSESKRRIYSEYQGDDLSCGSTCEHKNCYRCIAVNLISNGSILSQTKGGYCRMMKIDKLFQDMARKEMERMGLLMGSKNNLMTKEEAGFDCGEVYRDYAECHIVDIQRLNGNSHTIPLEKPNLSYQENKTETQVRDLVYNGKSEIILQEWEDEGKHYCRTRNENGEINVREIINFNGLQESQKKEKEKCNAGQCGCSIKKEENIQLEEQIEILSDAMALMIRKLDVIQNMLIELNRGK